MRDVRIWGVIAAFAAAGWLLAPFVFRSRPPEVTDAVPEIRYVCRKSGDVFTLPMTGAVLPHPTTGEPTLVPAVYDARLRKWRPGPPRDVMHRKGMLKPAS